VTAGRPGRDAEAVVERLDLSGTGRRADRDIGALFTMDFTPILGFSMGQ
jgi:hypothetical protein